MRSYEESPDYSADITPLILAAQLGHYEMVRMLLERGHFIEKPHIPSCKSYFLMNLCTVKNRWSSISKIICRAAANETSLWGPP